VTALSVRSRWRGSSCGGKLKTRPACSARRGSEYGIGVLCLKYPLKARRFLHSLLWLAGGACQSCLQLSAAAKWTDIDYNSTMKIVFMTLCMVVNADFVLDKVLLRIDYSHVQHRLLPFNVMMLQHNYA